MRFRKLFFKVRSWYSCNLSADFVRRESSFNLDSFYFLEATFFRKMFAQKIKNLSIKI